MNETSKPEANTEVAGRFKPFVMCGCGVNPATEPHSCPFAEEINDNNDPEYCTCCADCQHECAMDI